MIRLFIVGANPLTAQEEKKIQAWVDKSVGWWHWIDGFWIFVDPDFTLTAQNIRDAIYGISPKATTLVLQVSEIDAWAGCGPVGEGRNMFPWIHQYIFPESD